MAEPLRNPGLAARMKTVEAQEPPTTDVSGQPAGPSRWRALAAAAAGPVVIVAAVLVAMRGFVFLDRLSNEHPDILAFWLPRYCFLGQSLAAGHVPLWNPYQMTGAPFLSDPQSGWLSAPVTLFATTLPCATAVRFIIAVNPLLAGVGLYWFLRKEGLHRAAATAGGLSIVAIMGGSTIGLSLPFAGMLAWTPLVLVGASGYFGAGPGPARVGWLALAAFAWGQVAAAHMSHGLLMATLATVLYVAARAVRSARAGEAGPLRATASALAFLLVLPAANLALFIPRFALLPRTSLAQGYDALGQGLDPLIPAADPPLAEGGVWSGWPLALGASPGMYAGAAVLLAVPAALRGRRYLATAFGVAGLLSYLLTVDLLVGAGWFRSLVLDLPLGDVYLHNPGRLRFLMLLVVPVLGAVGIDALIRRPSGGARFAAAGAALFLLLPLFLGANPVRFILLAGGAAFALALFPQLGRGRRWAAVAIPAVLAAELVGAVLYAQAYRGGTVFLGLEGKPENLNPGPIRYPFVRVPEYLAPGPIALAMEGQHGRYVTWVPPRSYYERGYLTSQSAENWPALANARGMLFGLRDALGYSPIQLSGYWSYIRGTNENSVFYNAAVLQAPTLRDLRLLGVRYVVQPSFLDPIVPGRKVTEEGRYTLYEVRRWQPVVSVVSTWTVVRGPEDSLEALLRRGFNPRKEVVLEQHPGLSPQVVERGPAVPSGEVAGPGVPSGGAEPGLATYQEVWPEDVRITVEAEVPSIVLVRNAFDTGWTATVDGREAQVLRANHFLQGVAVPPGRHEIRLVYRDASILQGAAASGVVWSLLLVAALSSRGRRRWRDTSEVGFSDLFAPPPRPGGGRTRGGEPLPG